MKKNHNVARIISSMLAAAMLAAGAMPIGTYAAKESMTTIEVKTGPEKENCPFPKENITVIINGVEYVFDNSGNCKWKNGTAIGELDLPYDGSVIPVIITDSNNNTYTGSLTNHSGGNNNNNKNGTDNYDLTIDFVGRNSEESEEETEEEIEEEETEEEIEEEETEEEIEEEETEEEETEEEEIEINVYFGTANEIVYEIEEEEIPLARIAAEDIPMTEIPDEAVPQTGDSITWYLITVVSVIALAAIGLFGRREEENE